MHFFKVSARNPQLKGGKVTVSSNISSDAEVVRRLAFIRYFYSIAEGHSREPQPICNISILMFHDCVELFLQLAAEKHHVQGAEANRSPSLMDYWDIFKKQREDLVPTHKEGMRRLNSVRINLKHLGIYTHPENIETFRRSTYEFLVENSRRLFEIDFESVSMLDLVQCEKAKELLIQARDNLDNDLEIAMGQVKEALYVLIEDHQRRGEIVLGRSPFPFEKGAWGWTNYHFEQDMIPRAVRQVIDGISWSFKILTLGIDYRRYAYLESFSPEIFIRPGAKGYDYRIAGRKPVAKDVEAGIDFVVTCALKVQQLSFVD